MFICIEGNIGAGKSTLAKALTQKLKAHYLPEQFEDSTLLPLFYKDSKSFAFPTEYSFLIDRQKQLTNYFAATKKNTVTVSDFHFDKCICYAKANLSNADFTFYKKHFKAIQQTLPVPDLIVFLDVQPILLMENIKKRGRAFEKKLPKKYLFALKETLDKYYLSKNNTRTTVLTLPIKKYTPHTIEECCDKIMATIR